MSTINIGNNTGNSGSIKDDRIDSGVPDLNCGIHASGYTGILGAPRELRELQRLDLSSIPAGSTCVSAVLYLYDNNWGNRDSDCTLTIYKIADANGDWIEGTQEGWAESGSPCWNYKAYNTVAWAGSAGLKTAGTDYINTSLGSAIFTDGVSGYRAITLNAAGLAYLESLFGSTGGNGWILIGTGTGNTCTDWQSSQGTDTQRPYLAIEYTEGGGSSYDESLTLAVSGGMVRGSVLSAINSVSLALTTDFVRSVTAELNAGLSLGIAAEQGSGNVADMEVALALQATASMVQSAVGSLSASLDLDISMDDAFGTALVLQSSILLGATGGLSASGGMSLEDAATLGINTGMVQIVGFLLSAAVELNVQASQVQSATMTAEAQLALSIACAKIDSMGQDVNVSLALSIVADMAQWGIVPRIAAARHLYNALARKREYDATARKREYDAE